MYARIWILCHALSCSVAEAKNRPPALSRLKPNVNAVIAGDSRKAFYNASDIRRRPATTLCNKEGTRSILQNHCILLVKWFKYANFAKTKL